MYNFIPRCLNGIYYIQRNLFEILLNLNEIRLYLPFFNWFGTKQTSTWLQINRETVNTIWFRFDSIRFWNDFSVCRISAKNIFFQHDISNISNQLFSFHIKKWKKKMQRWVWEGSKKKTIFPSKYIVYFSVQFKKNV